MNRSLETDKLGTAVILFGFDKDFVREHGVSRETNDKKLLFMSDGHVCHQLLSSHCRESRLSTVLCVQTMNGG